MKTKMGQKKTFYDFKLKKWRTKTEWSDGETTYSDAMQYEIQEEKDFYKALAILMLKIGIVGASVVLIVKLV